MTGFLFGLAIAIVITAYLSQRIGPMKVLTIYKAPGQSIEIPIMPPTRWALFVGWLWQLGRIAALVAMAALVAWSLGGCS